MRTILFPILLLVVGQAQAQFPFPTDNAIWVNTLYTVVPFPPPAVYTLWGVDNYCANGADTTINATVYTKLEYCAGGYKGAFREEAGRVLYVPGDSLQEFLLYDFTLTDGQTATNVYYEQGMGMSGTGQVQDVTVSNTMISTDLQGRKVLYLQEGGTWIEGIGAQWGLFSEPWVNVSNYSLNLACMSYEDSVRYPQENIGPGVCPLTTSTQEQAQLQELTLYPNPTTDGLIRLQGLDLQQDRKITVTAADGRTLWVPIEENDGAVLLDLSETAAGLYLVHVTHGAERFTRAVLRQ